MGWASTELCQKLHDFFQGWENLLTGLNLTKLGCSWPVTHFVQLECTFKSMRFCKVWSESWVITVRIPRGLRSRPLRTFQVRYWFFIILYNFPHWKWYGFVLSLMMFVSNCPRPLQENQLSFCPPFFEIDYLIMLHEVIFVAGFCTSITSRGAL